jgi:predicted enzyme related to lactoylglutathione lyase
VIFYSENLEQTLSKIDQADGIISQIVFEFPGGRRFHFIEPGGNELAVWSDR